ncbi:MAG: metalloregulator ArsR/SmtB family transcription factor [Desulfobacteraceae bacterium]
MKQFIKVMKALSDPSRVKILKMLQHRKMCVCEIQEALGVAQSTASSHLKLLESANLTTFEKDGLWVNYALASGEENVYAKTLLNELKNWLEEDGEIEYLIRKLPYISREEICRK